jgi:acyl-coenzyme A thioesterase PaaI-like protein
MAEPARTPRAFFEVAGDLFIPRPSTASPWRAGHQNGVAIGSLLAHTLLRAEPPAEMDIARFTLDILRPAPMAPVRAEWRREREGRRTHVLEGSLIIEGVEVARASALFVRRADEGIPATPFEPPTPLPEDAPHDHQMPLSTGLESRIVQRGAAGDAPRPGRVWVRTLRRIVDGFDSHPVISAVVAADFGGNISGAFERRDWNSPNLDIAVHFFRPPRDAWILVEAEVLVLGNGSALVDSQMSDRYGAFGRSQRTLFITPATADRPMGAA